MRYSYKLCFCFVLLVVLYEVASADREDKSNEASSSTDRNKTRINQPRRVETARGSPDSHEAMNNHEMINSIKGEKMRRNKRSYEFLMGLINNNSRYEVTRKEPTDDVDVSEMKSHANPEIDVGSSELLLELVVKIAENPEQWSRVHKLLRQLDQDILTSKQLIDDFKNHTSEMQNLVQEENLQLINKKEENHNDNNNNNPRMEDKKKKKYKQEEINKEVAMTSDNGQPDINTSLFGETIEPTISSSSSTKEWPTFSKDENKVRFLNTDSKTEEENNDELKHSSSSTTRAYPKYFSYHIVTGKPIFINKNPKAYVAVSVVAPKAANDRSNEDLELEHELRQLKPWTHSQNLKNMESIRSRWVIESGKHDEKSET